MFNRRMRTLVPVTSQLLRPISIDHEQLLEKLRQRQERYQDQYDKHSRKLTELREGDTVWVEPVGPGQMVWKKAKVVGKYGRNSFIIELDGKQYRRSRVHLRKAQDIPRDEICMGPAISDTEEEFVTSEDESQSSNLNNSDQSNNEEIANDNSIQVLQKKEDVMVCAVIRATK